MREMQRYVQARRVWTDRRFLPAPLRVSGLFLTGGGLRSASDF